MSKAIFIGTGINTCLIKYYPNIKEWIFVDKNNNYNIENRIMKNKSYKKCENYNDNMLIFKNRLTRQKLTYISNCNIPNDYNKIKEIINNWDILVCINHIPDNIILNSSSKDKELLFIGNDDTNYNNISESNILNSIRLGNIKFSKYQLVTKDGVIFHFTSINDLANY